MEDFKDAFKHFDHADEGYVSAAQMRHILTSYGEKLKPEEVSETPHSKEIQFASSLCQNNNLTLPPTPYPLPFITPLLQNSLTSF